MRVCGECRRQKIIEIIKDPKFYEDETRYDKDTKQALPAPEFAPSVEDQARFREMLEALRCAHEKPASQKACTKCRSQMIKKIIESYTGKSPVPERDETLQNIPTKSAPPRPPRKPSTLLVPQGLKPTRKFWQIPSEEAIEEAKNKAPFCPACEERGVPGQKKIKHRLTWADNGISTFYCDECLSYFRENLERLETPLEA